jgi:RNA polymerase sigma-70 factor, ECF subfamily
MTAATVQQDPHSTPGFDDGALYEELRSTAARLMQRERRDHTLTPTALVHEAYLRLDANARASEGRELDRLTYLKFAVRVMRQVLVDHARRRGAAKRGGPDALRVWVHDIGADDRARDILELDDLLTRLASLDERRARVAELRILGGVGNAEAAAVLGIARSTAATDWSVARAWLAAQWDGEGRKDG